MGERNHIEPDRQQSVEKALAYDEIDEARIVIREAPEEELDSLIIWARRSLKPNALELVAVLDVFEAAPDKMTEEDVEAAIKAGMAEPIDRIGFKAGRVLQKAGDISSETRMLLNRGLLVPGLEEQAQACLDLYEYSLESSIKAENG